MAYLEYFPEEIIALQKELQKHPELLAKLEGKDLSESLAIIGAELGILLDGMYTPIELARLFLPKLQKKSAIILPGSQESKLVPVRLKETPNSVIIEPEQHQSGKK